MLRATRRLLRKGGRTALFTIYMPHDVPEAERRRARAASGRYGYSRAEHAQLMRSAGFAQVEEIDRTPEYLATVHAWHDRYEEHRAELIALTSRVAFEQRQKDRRKAIAGVEAGHLQRVLLLGVNPGTR